MLSKSSSLARLVLEIPVKAKFTKHIPTSAAQMKINFLNRYTRLYSSDTNTKKDDQENCESGQQNVEESKVDENVKEIENLNETIAEITDKYKRSLAENENIRHRMRREVHEAKIFGIQGFCKDLLEVSDILDKAVKIAHESIIENKGYNIDPEKMEPVKIFYDGVKMTEKKLIKVFKQHGLIMFEPKSGEKFDPYQHEAIFQVPTSDMEPGNIAHVQNHGYKLHERTIRPATVGVSKKP